MADENEALSKQVQELEKRLEISEDLKRELSSTLYDLSKQVQALENRVAGLELGLALTTKILEQLLAKLMENV